MTVAGDSAVAGWAVVGLAAARGAVAREVAGLAVAMAAAATAAADLEADLAAAATEAAGSAADSEAADSVAAATEADSEAADSVGAGSAAEDLPDTRCPTSTLIHPLVLTEGKEAAACAGERVSGHGRVRGALGGGGLGGGGLGGGLGGTWRTLRITRSTSWYEDALYGTQSSGAPAGFLAQHAWYCAHGTGGCMRVRW